MIGKSSDNGTSESPKYRSDQIRSGSDKSDSYGIHNKMIICLYVWFHSHSALGGGIDLFGDMISKHPEHENCADALQVIMHFRLKSLEFMIQ